MLGNIGSARRASKTAVGVVGSAAWAAPLIPATTTAAVMSPLTNENLDQDLDESIRCCLRFYDSKGTCLFWSITTKVSCPTRHAAWGTFQVCRPSTSSARILAESGSRRV